MEKQAKGTHIILDLLKCNCDTKYLTDIQYMKNWLHNTVLDSGLSAVGNYFHLFGEDCGFTGVIVLAESHISIHTWPEEMKVQCDVFTCNFTKNNDSKAEYIANELKNLYRANLENILKLERY